MSKENLTQAEGKKMNMRVEISGKIGKQERKSTKLEISTFKTSKR